MDSLQRLIDAGIVLHNILEDGYGIPVGYEWACKDWRKALAAYDKTLESKKGWYCKIRCGDNLLHYRILNIFDGYAVVYHLYEEHPTPVVYDANDLLEIQREPFTIFKREV